MKNKKFGHFIILSFLFLAISSFIPGKQELTQPEQKNNYLLIQDIFYRPSEEKGKDDYMDERCRLDIYYPADLEKFITVVWFHGGGLTGGNKSIPEQLKEKGIAVIAVNYRLSPRVINPLYIEDAAAAVAWAFRNIERYGGDASKIVVSGHSAGGYLTSMIGLDKRWLNKYSIDADRILMLVPFSGHTITHFTIRAEQGIEGTQPVVDEFAPLYHVRANAPPLILITGDRELELLGRYEENAFLWRMMKVAGHEHTQIYELDGFDHGAMALPAFEILLKFIITGIPK